ncbi:ABC transporter permease family protein [Streptosporangium soli]|nr:hypothetical protein [Streptosporangium sp. KLBMP 9127]
MSNAADRRRALFTDLKTTTPEERDERLRSYHQEVMAERRARPVPRWLARHRVRRSLAVSAVLPLLCGAVAATARPESAPALLSGLASAVSFLAIWLLLRRVTGLLAEAPDTALDEREVDERGQALHGAYGFFIAVMALLTVAAIADERWIDLELSVLMLGGLFTSFLLPSAVVAWQWRDLDDAEG